MLLFENVDKPSLLALARNSTPFFARVSVPWKGQLALELSSTLRHPDQGLIIGSKFPEMGFKVFILSGRLGG